MTEEENDLRIELYEAQNQIHFLQDKVETLESERDEAVKELESVKEELVAARSLLDEVAFLLRDGQRKNVF
jgi:peptidoglycan hydrolase CwlO-like protein